MPEAEEGCSASREERLVPIKWHGQDRWDEVAPATAPTGSEKSDCTNPTAIPTCINCEFHHARHECRICEKRPLCRTCWHPTAHSCASRPTPLDGGKDAPNGGRYQGKGACRTRPRSRIYHLQRGGQLHPRRRRLGRRGSASCTHKHIQDMGRALSMGH